MTWNLWWRFGDWRRRQPLIERVLAETAPDLIAFQEVWSTEADNQATQLAGRLGMHHAWLPSPAPEHFQRRIDDAAVQVGNAVLSRWPIVQTATCELPAGGGDAGRTALQALVEAPGGRISFTSTQLSSIVGGSALRCKQVRTLVAFVGRETPDDAIAIVAGDLNAEPDSDEIRLLGGHKTAPPVPGQVFVDAWSYAEPTAPGWTWDRRNPAVESTGEPSARIDYLFLRYQTGTTPPPRVRVARLAAHAPVDGLWPSDHAAVVAELSSDLRPAVV